MTARERVGRARALLSAGVGTGALLWGAGAAVLAIGVAAGLDLAMGLSREARAVARVAVLGVGAAVAFTAIWRGRRARSLGAVALWLEERVPALRYALVTVLEPREARLPDLERHVERVSWRKPLARALARAVAPPLAVLVAALLLLMVLPPGVVARVRDPRAGDALDRPVRRGLSVNHLDPLIARVRPPAYSGEAERVLEQPSSIAALVGSAISVEGRGAEAPVEARVGSTSLAVVPLAERWRISLEMPARPAALRLRDGAFERILVLEPRADSAPAVTLSAPARDTVFRMPDGSLALAADARDDIGLAGAWFEYIVSSGEGESFTFRSGVIGQRNLGGRRDGTLRGALRLDSLRLAGGDVVHLRAVARDANSVSGPGVGVSETRTLRIARRGEYDSVAVEGAPPPDTDKSELSQRMLIALAEALQRRRPRLSRESVVGESRRIGADQATLRKRVGEIIFSRLGDESGAEHSHDDPDDRDGPLTPEELLRRASEATGHDLSEAIDFKGDESPVVAINRPLLDAYNAMWDAGRELGVGEPERALPHMRAALAAIQRARRAERYYLRGRPPAIVVDVQKVRLAGNREGVVAAGRRPRLAIDAAAAARAGRFAAALRALDAHPAAAIDSLLLLRLAAIESSPALAAALGVALDSLRTGGDATVALARARRALAGEPTVRDTLTRWGGAW